MFSSVCVSLNSLRAESVSAYVPISVAVVVAIVQQARGELPQPVVAGGMVIVAVLIVRQVLAISENHSLMRDLEVRARRRDLLVDEEALFDFFDERVQRLITRRDLMVKMHVVAARSAGI